MMITKQITTITLHFDNFDEYQQYQEIYKKKGYKITLLGAAEDWYFECEKIEE